MVISSREPFVVLVISVWEECDQLLLRCRLTWSDSDGLPRSAAVTGSPRSIAKAVERLIEEALAFRE